MSKCSRMSDSGVVLPLSVMVWLKIIKMKVVIGYSNSKHDEMRQTCKYVLVFLHMVRVLNNKHGEMRRLGRGGAHMFCFHTRL